MNENIKLGKVRLDYWVKDGPAATLDFSIQLLTTLKKSYNDIRVLKLNLGYDMFTGTTEVSLEIQPGEGKERELREVFKQFERTEV